MSAIGKHSKYHSQANQVYCGRPFLKYDVVVHKCHHSPRFVIYTMYDMQSSLNGWTCWWTLSKERNQRFNTILLSPNFVSYSRLLSLILLHVPPKIVSRSLHRYIHFYFFFDKDVLKVLVMVYGTIGTESRWRNRHCFIKTATISLPTCCKSYQMKFRLI